MAAKPIPDGKIADIIADWRTGAFSYSQLADKHSISKAKVGQVCKGIEKDFHAIVDAGIQYHSGIENQDRRIVDAVSAVVDAKVRIKLAVERVIENAIDKAEKLIESTDSGADFKAIIDGIDKATVTIGINERHAKPTQIQNNQQNNYAAMSLDDIEREIKNIEQRRESVN